MSDREVREECAMVQRNTEAFLLRQLPEMHASLVSQHLASCGECFRRANGTAAVLGGLAHLREGRLPALRRTAAPRRNATSERFVFAAVAAGILALCGLIYQGSTISEPSRRTPPAAPAASSGIEEQTFTFDLSTARNEAVAYLLRSQREDGSWSRAEGGDGYDTGLTALSSIALFASSPHADEALGAAERACRFLAENEATAKSSRRGWDLEVQAARALALVDAAAVWPERFAKPATAAVTALVDRQKVDGSFDGTGRSGVDSKLGSALACAALEKAAKADFARIHGLSRAAARARESAPSRVEGSLDPDATPEHVLLASFDRGTARRAGLQKIADLWTSRVPETREEKATLAMASLLLAMN